METKRITFKNWKHLGDGPFVLTWQTGRNVAPLLEDSGHCDDEAEKAHQFPTTDSVFLDWI